MRALIVDSDPVCREFMQECLQEHGFEVVLTTQGREAWDVLQNPYSPRLVIFDSALPDMDAVELCRLVRERPEGHHVYLLVLSADSDLSTLRRMLDAGANDFVSKSASYGELTARLKPARLFLQQGQILDETRDTIRRQATHDTLTGLESRATILALLRKEFVRAQRDQNHLAVVLVDLDHFSTINEIYGRRAGDHVLCEVAKAVSGSVRFYDSAGRYGPEEFLVVAPGCNEANAVEVAERIRKSLAGQTLRLQGKTTAVTVSAGAISCVPAEGTTDEQLVEAVEAACLQAKKDGRNCVVRGQLLAPQAADEA